MTSARFTPRHRLPTDASSALIITLAVLLLVTVLVVSLTSMITLERTSSHSSFENLRARELASMALDEVVATLRDNIPTTNVWAAAPGQLTVPSGSGFANIPLYSGVAPGATTAPGQVDLNAPILGSATGQQYPIIATNSEFPAQTPMPVAWVEVLQDGTQVRASGGGETPSVGNPVVGRYAYWVDTETSKANINTAGKGQTFYTFNASTTAAVNATDFTTNDVQNLTCSPSRVDLSELDGGITYAQSLATYHYTYGGYFSGDYLTNIITTLGDPGAAGNFPSVPVNTPGSMPQGMQRFNAIEEWPMMTNDLFTGSSITPITSAQVEQNRFYLTTRSRTPEVTPWGFNKLWMQYDSDQIIPYQATKYQVFASTSGNQLNGKGVPVYPVSASFASDYPPSKFGHWSGDSIAANRAPTNFPTFATAQVYGSVPDSRYYVTPFFAYPYPYGTAPSYTNNLAENPDFQSMKIINSPNPAELQPGMAQLFLNNMMVQLNRTDWPGFSGESFVQKYGEKECEDFAFNILCLYDNTVESGGGAYGLYFDGDDNSSVAQDNLGYYGGLARFTVDGKTRLFSGVGEWPYFNELAASFTATTAGTIITPAANSVGTDTNYAGIVPGTSAAITNYTKSDTRPGFSTSIANTTNAVGINVGVQISAQMMYPPGFKNDYMVGAYGYVGLVDIAAYGSGTYLGKNVVYGSNDTTNGVDQTTFNPTLAQVIHPYFWGLPDSALLSSPNRPGTMLSPANGLPLVLHSTGSSPAFTNVTFPTIYVGPFDRTNSVDVQIRCRVVMAAQNAHTYTTPLEIAPLGFNAYYTGNTNVDEQQCFTNVMIGAAGVAGTTNTANAPTFLFDSGNFTPSVGASGAPSRYELADPRVYRYLNDWTYTNSGFITGYDSALAHLHSYTDPLTGVTGDDSKLAWPNIGASYYNAGTSGSQAAYKTAGLDLRWSQFANNIVGFPGIGWLSVLPLNCESSQPNVGGANPSNPNNGTNSIPWRTLSLEPSQKAGTQLEWLPDWLLLEAFSLAYDQTYCSQTDGKLNVNLNLNPAFNGTTLQRLKPFEALLQPSTYNTSASASPADYMPLDSGRADVGQIATDVANGTGINGGPCGNLPTNVLIYPGQLCQVPSMTDQASVATTTQWQRESLMRNLAGVVTTQCSDYKVYVVGQSVKQVAYTGNPTTDLVPTGEVRLSALVSRENNLGPDNLPDTGDEPATSWSNVPSGFTVVGTPTTTLRVATPTFKYVTSQINYNNN